MLNALRHRLRERARRRADGVYARRSPSLALAGLAASAQPAATRALESYDRALVAAVAALVLLGTVMVYSASVSLADSPRYQVGPTHFLWRHLAALALGTLAAAIAFNVPMKRWEQLAPWIFVGVLLLLVAVLFVGRGALGARRWIALGAFNLQPSELMKVAGLMYAASFTVRKQDYMHHFGKGFLPMATVIAIIGALFTKVRELYAKEGGKVPEPILNLTWNYMNPTSPAPEEVLREINGRALADIVDPKDKTKVLVRAGEQLPGFGLLQDDGTTACGNWIYSGVWTQAGNNSARRDLSDPAGLGNYLNWGYTWPANRRVLYNRAGVTWDGKPWDPKRAGLRWTGTAWAGNDVPDIRPDLGPDTGAGPFIMTPEGVARLFAVGLMADGPFPEHYEPFETPLAENPLHPGNKKAISNPVARVYKGDLEAFGKADQFPYAATTYRLTEHHHFWTKNIVSNAIVQPAPFVEIGEELAKEKGIRNGDMVKVRSNRGEIKAAAVVTKRIKALQVAGKTVHTVGIPIHWGFVGVAKSGFLANTLTPYVADANSQTPEYKAFLVNIEKA
jgi:hypothetical protein